jgi:hypothetical protein
MNIENGTSGAELRACPSLNHVTYRECVRLHQRGSLAASSSPPSLSQFPEEKDRGTLPCLGAAELYSQHMQFTLRA